ncbi:hypothetical protein LMTR3_06535 [Bradyrhizobium sp. LMTR 3]|nr:hypothetical protein LMTR3_06535 [Bradyrhizobium sp. LMTR 3]
MIFIFCESDTLISFELAFGNDQNTRVHPKYALNQRVFRADNIVFAAYSEARRVRNFLTSGSSPDSAS